VVNVIEADVGVRPDLEAKTEAFLQCLSYYEIDWQPVILSC